jgi:hypothetical protein
MPRTCTVCGPPERHAIEKALVAGGAYRDIAGRYGLTKSAVERQKAEHLPVALVRGEAAREEAHGYGQVKSSWQDCSGRKAC